MKKTYLKLGAIFLTSVPLLTVISCTQRTDKNVDEKIVDEIISKFGYNQKTTKNKFFPKDWTTKTKLTVKDLGIKEPEKKGAIIDYVFIAADLKVGSVVVSVEITKGKIVKKHLILISGYKTQHQQDEDDIDALELDY